MSNDIFEKCFKGCGDGSVRGLDLAADTFQTCVNNNNCDTSACENTVFMQFHNKCSQKPPVTPLLLSDNWDPTNVQTLKNTLMKGIPASMQNQLSQSQISSILDQLSDYIINTKKYKPSQILVDHPSPAVQTDILTELTQILSPSGNPTGSPSGSPSGGSSSGNKGSTPWVLIITGIVLFIIIIALLLAHVI